MNMSFKTPLKYGLIGALVACILGFLNYLFYRQLFSTITMMSVIGFVTFAITIFIPIWGGITFRRENGGVLSFQNAFIAVFLIYSMSVAGSSLMSYLIPNVIDKDYPEQVFQLVKNTTSEMMEKLGTPQDQIDKAMEKVTIEKFKPSILKTLQGFGISLLVAAAISLIIAAFVKRNVDAIKMPETGPSS